MSYLSELHAERKQRLARLGGVPASRSPQRPPPSVPTSSARTSKSKRRWPKPLTPEQLGAVPLSTEQRRAALAAADSELAVWPKHLDRVAKSLGIDEKHLTIVLLIGAIAECAICLANSSGRPS